MSAPDLVCTKQLGIAASTARRYRKLGLLPAPIVIRNVYYYPADALARAQATLGAGADAILTSGRRGRGHPRLDEMARTGGGR